MYKNFINNLLLGLVISTSLYGFNVNLPMKIKVNTIYDAETPPKQFKIQAAGGYNYDYDVDCETDGTFEAKHQTGSYLCTYENTGDYTISIRGTFPTFFPGGDMEKISDVMDWGTIHWKNVRYMFDSVKSFSITANSMPDLSECNNTLGMFYEADIVHLNINHWDMSSIKNMSFMFAYSEHFNHPIDHWDTSNVTDMRDMFFRVGTFNQPLGTWDTSSVTNMEKMFYQAYKFNQDIGLWDTSEVRSMGTMFSQAKSFNQDIGDWDTSHLTDFFQILYKANSFNQDIGAWDITHVVGFNKTYDVFADTNLSVSNYDSILKGWSKQKVQKGISFLNMGLHYCNAKAARNKLITEDGWEILDAGEDCSFHFTSPEYVSVMSGDVDVIKVHINHNIYATRDYKIVGGNDGDKFTIGTAGYLKFKKKPLFSMPEDLNHDNIYRVQIGVDDINSDKNDVQTLKVKVFAVPIAPIIYLLQ